MSTPSMHRTAATLPRSRTIRLGCLLLLSALAAPGSAAAQASPLSAHLRHMYAGVRVMLLRSAETMPEEHYGFRPADAVRTYGQIIGHLADTQRRYCGLVLGRSPSAPAASAEKTMTSKGDLVAALEGALAYCDPAYAGMTDSSAVRMIDAGMPMPALGVLNVNLLHATAHYGNLVTYMRMKGFVPPTSEPGFSVTPPEE